MSTEKMTVAENGLKIYSLTSDTTHSFYISLFLRAGSLYEKEGERGISHFYEHVAIRNVNSIMGGTLYSLLDKYGIEFNATTYSEMVQFYITGSLLAFDVAVDILSKLFLPITIQKSELKAELDRIRAEIREGGDRTSLAGFTQGIVFEETSLSHPITGRAGDIGKLSTVALERFRGSVLTADNAFVYVTGNVGEKETQALIDRLGELPLGSGKARENTAEVPGSFFKRGGGVYIKNADFTKLRFNFDLDMSRISVPETDLLYDQLLGGYNSKLFVELSEKRGICYDLGGSVERYKNIGSFSFSFELKASKLYEAVRVVIDVLKELKSAPLKEEECMKAGYVNNADMLLDDPRELNFTFAYDNAIMGLGYGSTEARKEAYRATAPDALLAAAREIFTLDNLTLTMKGDKKKTDLDKIREILSTL